MGDKAHATCVMLIMQTSTINTLDTYSSEGYPSENLTE